MNLFDTIYNVLQKYILISIGLWPRQSKIAKRFCFTIFVVSSCSLILALTAGLLEKWSTDPVIILENTMAIIFCSTGFVVSTILYIQQNKVVELYERIETDWEKLSDEKEIEILQTYTREGQLIVFGYVLYGVPAFLIFGGITYLPRLLDAVDIKEYSDQFPYYFNLMIINEDNYYIQISIHSSVVFSYIGISYLAVSCTFISSVKHVCGIYAIVCYRLQNVIEPGEKWSISQIRRDKSISFNLINVIAKHREAIHGVDMIEQIFSTGFLIMEIAALMGIAIIIADLTYNQTSAFQLFRIILITGIFVLYVFYINWTGEQVIQVSNDIRLAAYFIDWFTISIEARELLHMIIRRSCKTDKLTAGTIVVLSLENFLSILKTSWTAATVLLSTQRNHKYA